MAPICMYDVSQNVCIDYYQTDTVGITEYDSERVQASTQ